MSDSDSTANSAGVTDGTSSDAGATAPHHSHTSGPGKFADPDYERAAAGGGDTDEVDTADERSVRSEEPAIPEPGGTIGAGVGATEEAPGPHAG